MSDDIKPRNCTNPQERQKLLERLLDVWNRCPDLRLCQLIVNAAGKNDPFYVCDEVLFVKLDEYAKEHGK